ncbi:MAG TPA: hypothetical protein VMI73_27805 [Trebonia sp.]|nr:hypothetical protein [Trebonia sp.]
MKHLVSRICVIAAITGITVATLTFIAGTPGRASTPKVHKPAWHIIFSRPNGNATTHYNAFTAVVATSRTAGWAFLENAPCAYERTGARTWKKVPFPGKHGNVTLAGVAPDGKGAVWAGYYTASGTQLDRWTGAKWEVAKTFSGYLSGLTVLASDDVWVFGGSGQQQSHGVFHYNGRTWTEVARTPQGGDALSDANVWAYQGQTIDHFNGRKWTAFPSVKWTVTGIRALSATDVYATGDGTDAPHGGPMVLLHFNGRAWSRIVLAKNNTSPVRQGIFPDGKGGLWIPAGDGAQNPALLHYSDGKLTTVTLPEQASWVPTIADSLSRIPGTSEMLAGGVQYTDGNERTNSVVLQYS